MGHLIRWIWWFFKTSKGWWIFFQSEAEALFCISRDLHWFTLTNVRGDTIFICKHVKWCIDSFPLVQQIAWCWLNYSDIIRGLRHSCLWQKSLVTWKDISFNCQLKSDMSVLVSACKKKRPLFEKTFSLILLLPFSLVLSPVCRTYICSCLSRTAWFIWTCRAQTVVWTPWVLNKQTQSNVFV